MRGLAPTKAAYGRCDKREFSIAKHVSQLPKKAGGLALESSGLMRLPLRCYETKRSVNSEKCAQEHMRMLLHMRSISPLFFPCCVTLILFPLSLLF